MVHVLALLVVPALWSAAAADATPQGGVVSGELRQWHRVTVTFAGPLTARDGRAQPVPRLPAGRRVQPGRPSLRSCRATSRPTATRPRPGRRRATAGGSISCPTRPGEWTYRASFRTGPDVATSDDPTAGEPVAPDGARGSFTVGPSDKTGRDLRGQGDAALRRRALSAVRRDRRVLPQGRGRQPGELPGLRRLRRHVRPGDAGQPRQGEAAAGTLHRYARTCATGARATRPGTTARARRSSAR